MLVVVVVPERAVRRTLAPTAEHVPEAGIDRGIDR